MTYELRFHKQALKEWKKLEVNIQSQFKKKLAERLENPKVPASALSSMENAYKIKLRQTGYRLIYLVEDDIIYVTAIAVGKRDKSSAYEKAMQRLGKPFVCFF